MVAPKDISPQELRAIFGRNLRLLTQSSGPVATLCVKLNINRTQFLRYLNGQAFPRPDVLHRICTHFGVDARILLEPLQEAQPLSDHLRLADAMERIRPGNDDLRVSEAYFPCGFYRLWRQSFSRPGQVVVSLARVWRDGPLTLTKSLEPYTTTPYAYDPPRPPLTAVRGYAIRAEDGVVVIGTTRVSRMRRFTYLRQGHAGFGSIYSGYSVLGRDHSPGQLRAAGLIAEHLGTSPPPLLQLARETGYRPPETVPALFARHVMRDNPV